VHPILRQRVSPFWLVAAVVFGIPFLLGAAARFSRILGGEGMADALVGFAYRYATFPRVILGVSDSAAPESLVGYLLAGAFYFLLCVAGSLLWNWRSDKGRSA
jgi:hypothetical protein